MKCVSLARFAVLLLLTSGVAFAQDPVSVDGAGAAAASRPIENIMHRAASPVIDLRLLPATRPQKRERPELEEPQPHPVELPAPPHLTAPAVAPSLSAPAPAPIANFDGLDFATWGAGHPPDTNGDVGPTYFIQTINSSVGVFRKSDGASVAAFTLDALMSQGSFGNLCDTDNFGDPVVLYDTFEDRWIITDFAFQLDGGGNVANPPGVFQCFAVSKTGDPVTGGWNFYSIQVAGGLDDYPKFGIWPDGLYMSANMFGYPAGAAYQGPRVYALNKAQMYAGNPSVQIVSFNAPSGDFTLLPGNARLQTGTPPPGTPNYFVSTWQFTNALGVYKFHVDWNSISLSTFSGPDTPLASTSWPNANVPNALSAGGNALDVLQIRAMVQNQYSNMGGVESLWAAHTVRRGDTTGLAAPRWYQVNVTGGTVAANLPQAATWDPDGANVISRFMPSVAIDRAGDLALGYSTSSSTTKPAIKYAGRLAGDPVNTFSQTEQLLVQGAGTQTGSCGGTCTRWGDYSAMTLDPDGCTFWYTNEYYSADGLAFNTRIGSFAFPSCTPVGAGGSVSGTVTATAGGAAIGGATVSLGSRSTTTNAFGFYSFAGLPAGTYPGMSASAPGYNTASASSIVVTDGTTTTQNFSLATTPSSACLIDTTQADFQSGVATNIDLTTSPGDALLSNVPSIDQQNTTLSSSGVGITITTWGGQTFTPSVSGQLTQVDVNLFCSGCSGTTPNLTLSIRATTAGLPSGADLATATITGFNSGSSGYHTALFALPLSVTAGTQYAFAVRPTANPSPGTYALTRSTSDVYPGGTRVSGATSGTIWSIPLSSGATTDAGFKAYVSAGYSPNGDLVSSLKDSNPAIGATPNWSTLSWTGTTPGSTTLRFQAAASNASFGPFNFVGPDGTAATYFTSSSADLSQFNGNRYLRYRAYLATTDTAATPVLNDATVCYTAILPPPDLSITKTDGVTAAVPGGSVVYTITASNTSATTAANGVAVTDTFPAVENCTWTCTGAGGGTCTASGSGNLNDSVNLPIGASVTYAATCAIATDATGTLSNTAKVSFAGDPNPANDSATDTDTLTPQADLAISKTDGVSSVIPGGSTIYTIMASNAGPSDVSGATVADTFPAGETCTWVCAGAGGATCTASGSGAISDTINLPAAGSTTYSATCAISALASGTLSNTATVAVPAGVTDPTPGNNSATDTDSVTAQMADLAISKTDGVTSVQTGSSVVYTIVASNAGPDTANNAAVADTFPSDLTCASWTCSGAGGGTCAAASGSGNIASTVSLPSGGSATYTANCTVATTSSNTSLVNSATITAPPGVSDSNSANNSATDTDALVRRVDASITKTDGVTSAVPGNPLTYTIVASNSGPNAASVITADAFPTALTGCTWTCAASSGSSCAASGSGNINDAGSINTGGSLTYTATCTVSPTATGSVVNTATVSVNSLSQIDTNAANNSATDSDTLSAQANFGVTVNDNRLYVSIGDSLDYNIVVNNAGPSAGSVSVADTLPAGLGAASWVCTPSSGASCTLNGSGTTLNDNASVPPGGTVTYVYSATLQSEVSGLLVNTATATATGGVTDPVSSNNSATDTDVIVIFRDGFEGGLSPHVTNLSPDRDFTQAEVIVSQEWLDQLSIMPTTAFSGAGANGELFRVELLRMNRDLTMRVVTRDAHGMSERTPWRAVNLDGALLDFAWQAASSATEHNGYLVLRAGGSDAAMLGQRWERDTVVRLQSPLDARNVPAVTLKPIAH
ncbi:MAG: carboxypeptidase regulatory-like domain-containing protein [Dokdonella sp.]